MVVTDWFHPQWLAVGMLILLLCSADALLTLTLISHGAVEVNPLMAPLVTGSGTGSHLDALAVIALWGAFGLFFAVRGFSWEQRRS